MDGILISGEIGVGKPDPAIFREFIARFGIVPAETVYIDDWDRNIATAAGLGLVAIQFIDAARLRADLRRLGVAVAPVLPARRRHRRSPLAIAPLPRGCASVGRTSLAPPMSAALRPAGDRPFRPRQIRRRPG